MKELKQQKEVKKAKKDTTPLKTTAETKKKSTPTENKAGCKIVSCSCSNEFQDATYGKGRRVARRIGKSKEKNAGYKCTVCNAIHN